MKHGHTIRRWKNENYLNILKNKNNTYNCILSGYVHYYTKDDVEEIKEKLKTDLQDFIIEKVK